MPRERYRHDRGRGRGRSTGERPRSHARRYHGRYVSSVRAVRACGRVMSTASRVKRYFSTRGDYLLYDEFLDIPVLLWHIRRNALRWRDEPVSRTVCASCCQWRPISGQSTFNDNAARPRVWTIATSPQDDLVIVSSLIRAAANPTRLRALLPHVLRVARALARLRP